jgi:hypothetical protein
MATQNGKMFDMNTKIKLSIKTINTKIFVTKLKLFEEFFKSKTTLAQPNRGNQSTIEEKRDYKFTLIKPL